MAAYKTLQRAFRASLFQEQSGVFYAHAWRGYVSAYFVYVAFMVQRSGVVSLC